MFIVKLCSFNLLMYVSDYGGDDTGVVIVIRIGTMTNLKTFWSHSHNIPVNERVKVGIIIFNYICHRLSKFTIVLHHIECNTKS